MRQTLEIQADVGGDLLVTGGGGLNGSLAVVY
jgi:hypothetical protein